MPTAEQAANDCVALLGVHVILGGTGSLLVRDPIHGDIQLSAAEAAIMDTREMQRLRGIKQLGTAYLVYPGCHHTRFEHSLGTMHMASELCTALRRVGHDVSAADEKIIRIAALVHDVSHIPFGHTFEDERKVFPRHDRPERVKSFLFTGELGDVLERLNLAEAVYELLTKEQSWRRDIVASTIDADLLDYLRRDAYFAGLSQSFDERVLRYFAVADNRLVLCLAKRGMKRPDALSEAIHLLRMRYVLTERVYFHHAKVIAGAMISKAVEQAVARGLTIEQLHPLTDAGLLRVLATEWGAASRSLAEAVMERRLYKRAYTLSADTVGEVARWELAQAYHYPGEARDRLERRLADAAGLAPHEVIVYVPAPTVFKEAAVPVVTPQGVMPLNRWGASQLEISALEQQYRSLWRLWVFSPQQAKDAVARAAAKVFGLPNEMAVSSQ